MASAKRYDALITGSRYAGAPTALLLALRGTRVLMVDREEKGSDPRFDAHRRRAAERLGPASKTLRNGTSKVRNTTFLYGARRSPSTSRPATAIEALLASGTARARRVVAGTAVTYTVPLD